MGRILVKDYADAGLRRMFLTFHRLLHHRIEDKLSFVYAPTLIVRGRRDPIASQKWAREAVQLLPQGRLIEIPGEAHTLNFFAPRKFARVLRLFLGTIGLHQTVAS